MSLQNALVAGASLFALAGAANAQDVVSTTSQTPKQDPRDARIEALEATLAGIQDQLADLKAGAAADTADIRRVQAEAPALDLKNGRPTFSTADGNFKVSIRGLFQADAASYDQDKPLPDRRGAGSASILDNANGRDLSSGVNFRRARIGLEGTVYKDWNWALTYEAGGSGTEAAGLQQAWLEYAGFKPLGIPLRIRGGAYAWIAGLEDATSNTDGLFLERPAPAELVRSLAGGDGRTGVGIYANGERWNASAVWSGSLIGNPNDAVTNTVNATTGLTTVAATGDFDEQSGYLLRADGLLLKSQDYNLHVGVNVTGILQPADTTAPGTTTISQIRLRERPELRVDGARLIDTGNITANNLTAIGYELGFNYKNFLLTGEYFTIDVDRPGALPDPDFSGWYTQASWVLTGEQRKWGAVAGGFGGVKPDKPFDPSSGQWGAWEVAARYSTLDLNYNPGVLNAALPANSFRGGEQDVTTVGLNFYPNNVVRFLLDYQWVSIDRLNPTSLATSGIPVGAEIGQDYQAVSLRTQVAF